MDVFAKLTVRFDVVQVSHQEHPEKDFRINGWSSHSRCITSGGEFADERRFQNPIDLPQKVILVNERLQVDSDHRASDRRHAILA